MLVNALYNIVDTIFVGRGVGPLGITALTIVLPIQIVSMAVGIMVGIGSASIISRALGAGNKEKALKTAGTSIILNLLMSLMLMALAYIFIDRILYFFGASAETLKMAKDYMSIILIGFVSFSFAISSNNLIRAEGKPRASMYAMLIGAICNIILDPVFIFGLKMGVRGAAIATIISQSISAIYIISFFCSSKSIYKLKPSFFRLNPALSKEIMAVGFPSFALQIVGSAIFLIFNRSILHYGNNMYVAMMGIGLRVLNFIEMPIIGIAQGCSTLISFNYGAKKYERIKIVFKEAVLWTIAIAGFGFILLMVLPEQILGIFTNNKEMLKISVTPIRTIIVFLPFIGFQILGGSLFQSIGKTIPALVITLSRQLLILIPAVIILPLFFELSGIWLAMPVSNFFSILVTFIFVSWQLKKFNQLIKLRDSGA